jgi:DNA-binding CsgD family transcriptional regulator
MVYHRIEHFWEEDELRWLVCHVGSSTAKEPGNLRKYSADGLTYKEYSFAGRQWVQKAIEPLTKREKEILMLAEQGKNTVEIAGCLCRSYHTVRNQMKTLFEKLKVNSIREAIDIVSSHRMLYTPKQAVPESGQPPVEMSGQKTQTKIDADRLQRIQKHLDAGKSNRHIEMLEGVSERSIRYRITKGDLQLKREQ